jgi:hypothetical protein
LCAHTSIQIKSLRKFDSESGLPLWNGDVNYTNIHHMTVEVSASAIL